MHFKRLLFAVLAAAALLIPALTSLGTDAVPDQTVLAINRFGGD